jgi:uncharacterized RDD family membrane protein YckC
LIDSLIVAAVVAVSWYLLTSDVGAGSCVGGGVTINGHCRGFTSSGNRGLWFAIEAAAYILLFWVMQGLTGKTLGKAAMGIQVVNAEGRPPGIGRAALRSILFIVDGFPYLIPNLVGFIVALSSQRNQRVGDLAASTFVVDKNAAGAAIGGPGQPAFAGGGQQYGPPPVAQPPYAPPPQPPQPQQEAAQKADWYPDPQGQARLRYWDGQRWTEHTSA